MFLRFLRSLMPKEERFVEQFIAHSGRIVGAADALAAMMTANPADRLLKFREVSSIEEEADVIARQTVVSLHRAFITPFDRSDILALSNALDDAVDLIEEVAQRADLYQVTEFDRIMQRLARQIQDSARLVTELVEQLRDIDHNAERISTLCQRISTIENKADEVLHEGLSDLVASHPEAIVFLSRKELYELLEAVTDRCDDVADVIEGIVLEHV